MPVNNEKPKIIKQTEKRKEQPNQPEEQNNPNAMETVTLNVLHSKKSEQKHWLNFQHIVDGFQNKALFIDYWNKPDEFRIDLLKALSTLETKGKIGKKIVEDESYFSNAF